MQQRSPEWYAARCGKVTASRVSDVMAKGRGNAPSASRATYMGQLAAERLSGRVADSFTSAAMDHGTEQEPQARIAYEFLRDVEVVEVGSIDHPTIPMFSASPDGLIGDDGLIEIKCPNSATHIRTLLGSPIDRKYLLQMQVQMACTGRLYCDFVSFDPRMPAEMGMHIERIARDPLLIVDIETEVSAFLAELDAMVSDLRRRFSMDVATK